MTEGREKAGVRYLSAYMSPLGPITVADDGADITGLWFDGQKYDRAGLDGYECEYRLTEAGRLAARWLDIYFSGREPDFMPSLAPEGSVFRRRIWDELRRVPYGLVITYGELARRAGCRSARAVGGAVGHNPVSIMIPCHRIIGAGGLTGYAGGVDKKSFLLALEGVSP